MDWNIDEFANALEHDLGCPMYADLVIVQIFLTKKKN